MITLAFSKSIHQNCKSWYTPGCNMSASESTKRQSWAAWVPKTKLYKNRCSIIHLNTDTLHCMIYILHHLSFYIALLSVKSGFNEVSGWVFTAACGLKGWAQGKVIACIQWLIQRSRRSPANAKAGSHAADTVWLSGTVWPAQISEARDKATPIGKGGRRCKTSRNKRDCWITTCSSHVLDTRTSWLRAARKCLWFVGQLFPVVPRNRCTQKPIKPYH